MPGKASADIFMLIKSLTKPEKRYSKIYASMGNSKQHMIYLQLFDVIETQKKQDEKRY